MTLLQAPIWLGEPCLGRVKALSASNGSSPLVHDTFSTLAVQRQCTIADLLKAQGTANSALPFSLCTDCMYRL